jgi:hypothetical protein
MCLRRKYKYPIAAARGRAEKRKEIGSMGLIRLLLKILKEAYLHLVPVVIRLLC